MNENKEPQEPGAVGSNLSAGLGGDLTPEQIIAAKETRIAMLQGTIRWLQETAAENSRIRAEDHNALTRQGKQIEELKEALNDEYSSLTPSDRAPCQKGIVDRCRCARCRRDRWLSLTADT